MRIVIVEKDIDVMGGVERVINTLANSLCDNNEVYVISEHKNNKKTFFLYNDDISIMYILNREKRNKFGRKSQNIFDKFVNKFERIQDKYITRYMNKDMINIIKSADCIIFGRVQVAIHFLPYLYKNKIKCKIIVRDAIHLETFDNDMKLKLKKYFPKCVDTFVVSSDESMKRYQNFFDDYHKINIKKIYNPLGIVPCGEYDHNAKTFVSLGRLDDQKGFENLILAFNIISKKYTEWRLKIYGTGPLEKKLTKLIEDNHLSDKVQILSGTNEIIRVLNSSTVFVMTSRYEGYANMLVEAMSCGMPAISYDWLMGVDEIIENKVNGIIVPLVDRFSYFKGVDSKANIENLSLAMEDLICNPNKCEILSSHAKKIVKSRDKNVILNEWNKIIYGK